MRPSHTPRRVAAICPERLYPLRAFQEASGIGSTRMREGRLAGIHLETIAVGRRKFVQGETGIAYIKALAQLTATARA
jgi:hypothetical protein